MLMVPASGIGRTGRPDHGDCAADLAGYLDGNECAEPHPFPCYRHTDREMFSNGRRSVKGSLWSDPTSNLANGLASATLIREQPPPAARTKRAR